MTLIDTAEMYAEGRAEQLLGEALDGLRDQVFLVSKVFPYHGSRDGVRRACEDSLRRLRTDHLDLYLLHWPGTEPLSETLAGFEDLLTAGKIRHWGVSNFDPELMQKLFALPGGDHCATNQILYNLTRRGPEFDLLPWMESRSLPFMAYSPLEQGRLPIQGALAEIAARHGKSPWQVALAWVLRRPDAMAIPKTSSPEHLRQNLAALELQLSPGELAALDAQFPPPSKKRSLETL